MQARVFMRAMAGARGAAALHRSATPCGMASAAFVLGMALAAPARAQETKLSGAEIEAALVGKPFRVRTERVPVGNPANPSGMTRRSDGGYAVTDVFVRPDHSIIFVCTHYNRAGFTTPCGLTGGAGTRDAGVWSVSDNRFCYQFLTARGGQEQCYDVLRDSEGLRFRLASGPPSTIDGERLVPK